MSYQISAIYVDSVIRPLGLDDPKPLFSWRFAATVPMKQARAQILVGRSPGSEEAWNSGVLETDRSIGIRYDGYDLTPETRYYVTLRTWDLNGLCRQSETEFETGMLNTSQKAWEGAQWIGAPEYYVAADTMSVFTIESSIRIKDRGRAGIVFGADDPRLLDQTKNESLIEGENFIRYVLNLGTKPASIEIFRVGYAKEDLADKPFAVFPAVDADDGSEIITDDNIGLAHTLRVVVTGNCAYTYLDGICVDKAEKPWYFGTLPCGRKLNPLGEQDITSFPRLCSVGYYVGENTHAFFDGLRVFHNWKPQAKIVDMDSQGRELRGELQELHDPSCHSIPMLRRDFTVHKGLKSARLYATARGIYHCCVNGKRVGNEYFAPGASQFDKHLIYQTYDVTEYLKEGMNGIGCTLASGWWCDSITYTPENYNFWGDRMSFLGKLVLRYEDGRREVVVTSPGDWQYYGEGPFTYAGFFNGEHFDARRAEIFEQFSMPGYRIAGMKAPAVITPERIETNFPDAPVPWPTVNETEPALTGSIQAPVHEVEVLTAKSVSEPVPGVYIYDLGQEIAGVPRVRFKERSGQKITLRYGEMLYPSLKEYEGLEGQLLQVNLREASNTDIYICRGDEEEVYQPLFTFHGFRYIEISGVSHAPLSQDVQGVLLSSVDALTGGFRCSNPLVNKLVSNVGYSHRCNFISIPTDCPQRNERMGWVGDTHVFCRTATYQSNVKNFYLRNLQAMRDLQTKEGRLPDIAPMGGGFGGIPYESAMILMVWELFQQYGDPDVVREFYPCMQKWMDAMERAGFPGTPPEFGLGDWLAPEETDLYLIWNAFHYRNCTLMKRFAALLDKADDADRYEKKEIDAKAYWNRHFVDDSKRTKGADGALCDSQASYAIALSCGVVDDTDKRVFQDALARKTREHGCTVQTGFFGTDPLNPMLSEGGYAELAQALINQTACPSWLYPVTQGATTVWERWDSYTFEKGFGGNNAMNSFNHYSLGSIVSWLYAYVLGIRRDENQPGYRHFVLRPEIGGFDWVSGFVDTPFGAVKSAWDTRNGRLEYRCTIPPNACATLVLNGKTRELASGSYCFTEEIQDD